MNKVLVVAAIGEAATGLALVVAPALVARLLVGEELAGMAIVLARVAGIALIGLGIACWPGAALAGMLTYSVAITVYLGYLGLTGSFSGLLLWPVVVLHGVLTVLLARGLFGGRTSP